MKFITLLFLLLAMVPVFANDTTHYADVHVTYLAPDEQNLPWTRESHTPKYPLKLARMGITGCGVYRFDINEDGKATDIEVIAYQPKKLNLKVEGRKLVKSWQWSKADNIEGNGITARIDFCLGGESVEDAQSRCAMQATKSCN